MKKQATNPYLPKSVSISSHTRQSPDTFSIILDWQIKHKPGQFVQISVPGIGEAPISISSYSDKHVELTIREVGNVTKKLGQLKQGDEVFVRGPYGNGYSMDWFKDDSLIIVGGGCGVAPQKGIVEFIEKNRDMFKEIYLFFGFRGPEDTLFGHRIKEWEDQFNVHISVDKIPEGSCYSGNVGFITSIIDSHHFDNHKKIVMMCGPPIMMKRTAQIFKNKGFNDDQIFVSSERLMYCAVGRCGHCMNKGKYTCIDGPVFRYDEMQKLEDE